MAIIQTLHPFSPGCQWHAKAARSSVGTREAVRRQLALSGRFVQEEVRLIQDHAEQTGASFPLFRVLPVSRTGELFKEPLRHVQSVSSARELVCTVIRKWDHCQLFVPGTDFQSGECQVPFREVTRSAIELLGGFSPIHRALKRSDCARKPKCHTGCGQVCDREGPAATFTSVTKRDSQRDHCSPDRPNCSHNIDPMLRLSLNGGLPRPNVRDDQTKKCAKSDEHHYTDVVKDFAINLLHPAPRNSFFGILA